MTGDTAAFDWRSQAQAVLPELAEEIAASTNSMQLWIEIGFAFSSAYDEPRNEDLIRRIYGFASWCIEQPRSEHAQDDLFKDDLFTSVVVCFYEHIPLNKVAWADMPRWFTEEEVRQNKKVFSYHSSAAEYEELLALFAATKTEKHKKSHNKN